MSGGERARIALLKLMLKGSNFLLLDEPTNHLDTAFREQLEDALLGFEGTMLVISHDRYFINKLADRILVMSKSGMKEYLGNYDYYLEKTNESFDKGIFVSGQKKKPYSQNQNEYALKKERQSNIRKAKAVIKRCEESIAKTEERIEQLQSMLAAPEVISDYEKLTEYTSELEALNNNLERLMEEWENAEQTLEELSADSK